MRRDLGEKTLYKNEVVGDIDKPFYTRVVHNQELIHEH